MAELPPLESLNWDSGSCECKLVGTIRRYIIGRDPGSLQSPERVWCHLHQVDGSVSEIPMEITTTGDMVATGLQSEYWAESRRRQLKQVAQTEQLMRDMFHIDAPVDRSDPRWVARFGQGEEAQKLAAAMPAPQDLEGWEGVLYRQRLGKTYADHEGYRRSPGSQTRGHLSHRCPRHDNQTSVSLMSQLSTQRCGCVIRQITVGERREFGVTHEQLASVCDFHKNIRPWAKFNRYPAPSQAIEADFGGSVPVPSR